MTPTHCDLKLYRVLRSLYRKARTRDLPIRLLGVALSKLTLLDGQLELFDPDNEGRCSAVDAVRDKFGYHAVHVATTTLTDQSQRDSGP